jgi:hypothetical protein
MRCITSSPMRSSLRSLNQGGALRGACLAGGDGDGASCLERSLGGRLRAVPEAATDSLLTQVPRSSALGSSLAGCCIERSGQCPLRRLALVLQTGPDHNILGGCIKMRWRGYVALPYPAISTHSGR